VEPIDVPPYLWTIKAIIESVIDKGKYDKNRHELYMHLCKFTSGEVRCNRLIPSL